MFKFLTLALLLSTSAFADTNILLNKDNAIAFNQPVSPDYVAKKELEILVKSALLPKSQPLYLILDTPGGSVMAGNQFIDFVKSLNRPVHTIVIFAASMGYQITQELGKRYIINSGTLMSHRGAVSGMSGQIPGELNARIKMIGDILYSMNKRAAKRVGMSVDAYQNAIINELWVSGEEAVSSKHADDVAHVSCDKSLSGSYFEVVSTMFGAVTVEYSNCPTISGPIGFKLGNTILPSNSIGAKEARGISRKVRLEF